MGRTARLFAGSGRKQVEVTCSFRLSPFGKTVPLLRRGSVQVRVVENRDNHLRSFVENLL